MMVWQDTLDGKYRCRVVRNGNNGGILTVQTPSGQQILKTPVPLSFGARFGPDVSDVNDWEGLCVEAVDQHEGKDKE